MARLPKPGLDNGVWGKLLNDYLSIEHAADGTLANVARPSDVAAKYTKPSTGIPATDLDGPTQTKLVNARDAVKIQGAPVDASVPANGQVLSFASSSSTWVPSTVSSTVVPDATTTTKGLIQLAGDLSGTASAPKVAKLNGVAVTGTPSTGQILTATGTSAAGWAAAPTAPVTSVNSRTGAVVVTKSDVGLSNVDNTADTNKPVSTATQTALNLKASTSSLATVATSGSYTDLANKPTIPTQAVSSVNTKTGAVVLVKADVGLGNVDNTADINKPVSTAAQTALNLKANSSSLATVATSGSYTDLTNKPAIPTQAVSSVNTQTGAVVLAKADVGLANVDNTADINKPVSTAVQTALNAKTDSSSLATVATSGSYADLSNKPTIPTQAVSSVNTQTGAVVLAKGDVGLGNVDNTSDVTKNAAAVTLTNKTISGASNTLSNIPESAVTNLTSDLAAKASTASLAAVATSGSYADLTNKPAGATNLVPTAVKTAAYTAAVADLIPVNTTSAAVTVTLPTGPADKSQIAIKLVTGTNTVTIAAGGSDVFNTTGGSSSLTLTTLYQAILVQYQASAGIWYVIADSQALSSLDSRFAPLGAAYKVGLASSGDQVFSGYDLVPNGLPVVAPATISSVLLTNIYPTIGGSQVWRIAAVHANGNEDVITTLTVADGARAAVVNSLTYAVVAGDVLLVQCTAANGSTYSGLGPSVQIAYGGTQTVRTAPGATSGLTTAPSTGTVTLSWTAGAGSTGTLILRDGSPYVVTGNTTYADTGLASGTSHVYSLAALVPGNISAISSGVTAGPSTVYTYYSQTDGSLASSDWATTLGASAGTAAQIASNILTVTSGAAGTNASADRVHVDWIKDSGTHSAMHRSWQFGFGTSNAIIDFYFSASSFVNVATSFTSGIQLEMNTASYRIGFKAPSINSGSFNNLTATGSGQATTTASGGTIAWPSGITADGAHYYGLMVDLLPTNGDGTQTMNLYFGTTAQQIAGTMPLINTITFTAAQRTAMATGYHYLTMLGAQGTGAAQIYKEQAVTLTPLTPAGS